MSWKMKKKTEKGKIEKENTILDKLLFFRYGKYLSASVAIEVWPFILESFANLRANIFILFTLTKICFLYNYGLIYERFQH